MIKSRRMRWTGHIAWIEEKRNPYRILGGKREEERPLERPRRRWVDNIKIDLRELGWVRMEWIDVAQEGSCEHCNEPSDCTKCWKVLE
jgi:hypothetical protein